MSSQYLYDRGRLAYELLVRQEPKQARMCGVGGKADRRPIDPPPIVQLRVVDPAAKTRGSNAAGPSRMAMNIDNDSPPTSPGPRAYPDDSSDNNYSHSFLQNPYYFMFASLARPDDDAELHWLKDGKTRCTTGSVVSSLYHLKDPQNNNEDAGFFVFPDLSVRTEGSYRLKLSLFEVVGNNVHHCKSIYSAPFYVYTAKKFPGMEESTPLSCALADQGIKIRIRKDIRVRKRPNPALTQPLPINADEESDGDHDDDEASAQTPKRNKRSRLNNTMDVSGQQLPWPPVASLNPALGPNIPPPPAAPPNSTFSGTGRSASGSIKIPPPPKPGQEVPPENGIARGVNLPPGGSLPGPSVFDGRGGGLVERAQASNAVSEATTPTSQQQQPQQQANTTSTSPVNGSASAPAAAPPQYTSQPTTPAATPVQPSIPPPAGAQHQPVYPAQQPAAPAPAPVAQQQPHVAPQPASQNVPSSVAPHMRPAAPVQQHPQQASPPANPQAQYAAPPPYTQWGAPPPPPQQPVYQDPYYAQQHYAAYAPPPQHARYDYPPGMYTTAPPPPMGGYGYYDQHQQMMHPHQPPPHGQHVAPHPSHPAPPPHPYGQPYQQHPGAHPGYGQPPGTPTAPTTPSTNSAAGPESVTPGQPATSANGSPMQPQTVPGQQASQVATQGVTQQQQQPSNGTTATAGSVPATSMAGGYDYNAAVMYNTGRPHPGHAPPPSHAGYPQAMPAYGMHPQAPQAPHPSMVAGGHGMPRHNPYAPPPNHQPQPQPQMLQHHHHPHVPPPPHPHAHNGYSYATPYGAPPPPHHAAHPGHPMPQQPHEWGAPPPPPQQQFAMTPNPNASGWDMYGHQQQQHQAQQHPGYASHVQMPTQATAVGVGPGAPNAGTSSDRIQLAPLLPSPGSVAPGADGTAGLTGTQQVGVVNNSPSMRGPSHNPSSSHSSPSMGQVQLRSSSRTHGHGHPSVYVGARDAGVATSNGQGKKNPLSIGSIISDDVH